MVLILACPEKDTLILTEPCRSRSFANRFYPYPSRAFLIDSFAIYINSLMELEHHQNLQIPVGIRGREGAHENGKT